MEYSAFITLSDTNQERAIEINVDDGLPTEKKSSTTKEPRLCNNFMTFVSSPPLPLDKLRGAVVQALEHTGVFFLVKEWSISCFYSPLSGQARFRIKVGRSKGEAAVQILPSNDRMLGNQAICKLLRNLQHVLMTPIVYFGPEEETETEATTEDLVAALPAATDSPLRPQEFYFFLPPLASASKEAKQQFASKIQPVLKKALEQGPDSRLVCLKMIYLLLPFLDTKTIKPELEVSARVLPLWSLEELHERLLATQCLCSLNGDSSAHPSPQTRELSAKVVESLFI